MYSVFIENNKILFLECSTFSILELKGIRELRKLLQMGDCLSIGDTSREAARIRDTLCEKLWLEKQTGKVS